MKRSEIIITIILGLLFVVSLIVLIENVKGYQKYDCKFKNITIIKKDSFYFKEQSYYVIAIDEQSNLYKINCTKEQYQFTHIGSNFLVAECELLKIE